MARTETLTVAGNAMEVYVDEPAGAGPHPAMVVAHHRGALDAFTREELWDVLQDLCMERKPTVVLVTHDPELANRARRIIRLSGGEIVEDTGSETT